MNTCPPSSSIITILCDSHVAPCHLSDKQAFSAWISAQKPIFVPIYVLVMHLRQMLLQRWVEELALKCVLAAFEQGSSSCVFNAIKLIRLQLILG